MNESGRVSNVLRNTISGLIQRGVTILAGFALQVLFIRILGIAYAGLSALFTSVVSVLSLAELGMGTAIVYSLYRPVAERDPEKIAAYMRFYARIYRLIALVILCAGLCVAPFVRHFVRDVPNVRENIHVIYLLTLADTVLSYLLIYKSTLLIAAQKNRIVTNVQTAISALRCALAAAAVILWKNYYLVLIIFAALTIVQNLLISLLADREFPGLRKIRTQLDRAEIRALFANVRAMALYKVSGVVLNSTDNILISASFGTEKVGILSNYNLVINHVYQLVTQFFSAVSSSVGNLGVQDDREKEHAVFRVLNFISFWIYCFCSVSILTLVQPFLALVFGDALRFAMPVVLILVLDFYIKGMLSPVSSFRTAHGLFTQGKYRPLVMAMINVALSIVLLRFWRIAGVLAATVISRLATQVWYDPLLIHRRVFHRPVRVYFGECACYLLAACLAGLVTYGAAALIPAEHPLWTLLIRAGLCLLIPNLTVVLLYGRTARFRSTVGILRDVLGRLRGRSKN